MGCFYRNYRIFYQGPKFTWSNCQDGQDFIKESLDRGVANVEWSGLFPEAEILIEVVTCSDHAVLILNLVASGTGGQGRRCFKYEAKWVVDKEHHTILQHAWKPALSDEVTWEHIGRNLNRCKQGLVRWQRGTKCAGQESIHQLQNKLQEISGHVGEGVGAETQSIKQRLQILLDKEAVQWQQRAKIDWLRGGDRNTSFFHACANS